ncbi:MAG TPA: pyridoxal phosphate-dependent aminotransferase, partial [Candidatus Saccharimonadales bacterium]|nr:pyridoxal phosphate-dependent aminotransferase [Candidatus Saccharimonadales bacterium]
MARKFSFRTEGLAQSEIRRMSRECERAGGVNLGQGICDQPVESAIRRRAAQAIDEGRNQYSKFEGIDPLRSRIAAKAASYNAISCDPDTQIVVTVGSTGAFALACLALLDPGDEAVVFAPYYAYHVNTLRLCGAKPVFIPLAPPAWEIDDSALEAAFSGKTRMVVVNTPCNPCGKVFTRGELERIGELARAAGAVVVTDEIYEYILFDGNRHVSLASLPGMSESTITISGFSKTYSMTGWRLGYAIAPVDIAEKMGLLNDLLYVCAPTPLQHGVIEAMDLPPSYYDEMSAGYARRRDLLAEGCRRAGIEPCMPQGAYYFLADVSALGCPDDAAAAALLLQKAGVACVPGG